MKRITLFCILLLLVNFKIQAQNPWPAESWSSATNLTALYNGFSNDLSGAHWNSLNRELWLVINGSGTIVKVVENGIGGFEYEADWDPDGDLEGITQADLSDETVFVIQENTGLIKEFDISSTSAENLIHSWDISPYIPEYSNSNGPEGIAFVPDEWLVINGFRDESGGLYSSQHGMGGLIFIAHQNGGNIYVFDLNRITDSYNFVGEYKTNRDESAGLEFDRSTGYLHIWHNTGDNYLEITDLSSIPSGGIRKFTMVKEFLAPKGGNLEGYAFTPASTNEDWCWITEDDGDNDAIRWFDQFDPCLVYADFTVSNDEICQGTAITFNNVSIGACGSEDYQWNFGEGASPETATGEGPHIVAYNTAGDKNITLTVVGNITDIKTKIGLVTVHPTYSQTETVLVCSGNSYTFPDGTTLTNITSPVIDTSTLYTVENSCDSVIITTVNISSDYFLTDTASVCSGGSYTFPDGTILSDISSPLIDTSILSGNGNSCDSLIITFLGVASNYSKEISTSVCNGENYTFPDGTTLSNITSLVVDTSILYTVENFCDSIIITTVNVNPVYAELENASVCSGDSYTFPDGSTLSNITNSVVDTSVFYTVENSCDSLIITNLEVISIDTSVAIAGTTLTSNEIGVAYQWIDCSSMSPISGENGQTFTALINGSYAVIITKNECTDTSNCKNVIVTSIQENNVSRSFSIFPNPTSGKLQIDLNEFYNDVTIFVNNLIGQNISTERFESIDKVSLEIKAESGIYFVKIITDKGVSSIVKIFKY